ncbi:hypothetical protein [Levilactobacillus spicheri]|uniref:Integral membrane protein n=2 Tax=Levilactobacillus spicheri TaxID=216463 RepID=A0ABQ0WP60_9LACO|nr:hypothetical protein [Levilactobacillus spicheri]KRL48778.1 hypothetical protein FD37_GL001244 [Levilactobacillus spicheri DSM 15429]GEO66360.1 hypothetical protein LSP04_07790 [Levilactobacillus spicheri]
MNRLKQLGIDVSVGTLNFLANTGIMLPYILILFQYQKTQSATYLITLVAVYISRAASIFYTKRLNLRSSTYLILTLVFGALGSLPFALTTSLGWLIAGSVLWGYSAATIWPYFLTVKLHLTHTTHFKMKSVYWLVFLLMGLLLGLDFYLKLSFSLSFALLAVLNLVALPGGLLLNEFTHDFYRGQPNQRHGLKQFWRWWLSVVFFAAIALLTTLRKASLNISYWVTLGIILVALVIALIELYADRTKLVNFKLRLINRGFMLSYVLLFSSFMAYYYWGKLGMYLVFVVYLIGFEGGAGILGALAHHDADQKRRLGQGLLIAGHLLVLIPWKWPYLLGLLLIALYIGDDNPTVNRELYESEVVDDDSAIINKYRFSTAGGLLCQLVLFGLLVVASATHGLSLLAFFKPANASHWFLYTWAVNWPLVLCSLGITLANIVNHRKQAAMEKDDTLTD